ncbi:MAG: HWE histidine kinase domain-containing protein [Pseudomonadota bacterium]
MLNEHADLKLALENCNRDPIHIPGAIQGFGYLVAGDAQFQVVHQISANCGSLFDVDPRTMPGRPVADLLDRDLLHDVRNALGHETIEHQRMLLPNRVIKDVEHQIAVHRRGDRSIVEFVPEIAPMNMRLLPLNRAREFLTCPLDINAQELFWEDATELMRSIVGYERVMFYRFLPEGTGEVVAESRHPEAPSFLGLRFPASDIPPIARQLYAKTPIRVIFDVNGPDQDVLALADEAPLDMSLALLRGKDQVHQKYLQNMGVAATMTVPIVVDGILWGLFAAHNRTTKTPDPANLAAAELAGKLISLRLQHAIESRKQSRFVSCGALVSQLVVPSANDLGLIAAWEEVSEAVGALINCDGVALIFGDKLLGRGAVPPERACWALLSILDPSRTQTKAISDLRARFPAAPWDNTGGALIVAVASALDLRLVFFRNAVASQVTWAGAPKKQVRKAADGPRLDPRNSFDTYIEDVQNRCDEWTADDIELGEALARALERALDSQEKLRQNQNRMGLMVRELNHRVRNILSLVQSLSEHSREEAKSVTAYATALEERIQALAGAHNLLTRADMKGVRLSDLIALELRPFNGTTGRAQSSGPDLVMRPDAASVLALLFHELTSNAAKYGALSVPEGHISVTWITADDGVRIRWAESNGPEVTPPDRNGFGRSIIEDAIAYEFRGKTTLEFAPAGVCASFWLPGETISTETEAAEIATGLHMHPKRSTPVPRMKGQKHTAMVVEDNYVVALSAKRMLRAYGFETVIAVASTQEALAELERSAVDFTLLDVNLQGTLSTQVAQQLVALNLPFAFATGYGSEGTEIVEAFDVPVISKPINAETLDAVLTRTFG